MLTASDQRHGEGIERGRQGRWWWRLLLLVLLLTAVALGLAIGDDFGMSTDEPDNAGAARAAMESYTSDSGYERYLSFGDVIAHHGPSYFMAWETLSNGFIALFPNWHITDGHHFTNYLTFLLGLACFYLLARRLLARELALFATAFFGTQPLLFGHAFVNQKDTPFWAFLLASLVVGLAAVDNLPAGKLEPAESGLRSRLKGLTQEWQAQVGPRKWVGPLLILVSLLGIADVLFFQWGFGLAEIVLRQAHVGESWPFLNRVYATYAEDAHKVAADVYVEKLRWAYWVARAPLLTFALVLFPLGVKFGLPGHFARYWRRMRPPILLFLAAGVVLGFTLSIRPIGLLAAGLVGLYWLTTRGLQHTSQAVPYAVTTGLATYATWPYLWQAPIQRFVESLFFTGSFLKETLYWGEVITSDALPWHYFPSYLATEMTEPTIPLLLLGGVTASMVWRRDRGKRPVLLILLVWIFVPLFALIALGMGVYGNIRHLLFVLVPLTLLAGLGFKWIAGRLASKELRVGLASLLLLPGVLGLVRLHPYQYSYFNSFIGGVEGASGQHLLDRWCIAYREAMDYVNQHAEPDQAVAALYSSDVARPFAREDLFVGEWFRIVPEEAGYFLTCAFFIGDYDDLPNYRRVHLVEVQGAILAEIYERVPASTSEE